eukprot:PRCOL_00002045-RA
MCPHPPPARAEVRVRGGAAVVRGATASVPAAANASASGVTGAAAAGTAPNAPVAVLAHGLCLNRTEWAAVEKGLTTRGIECFSYEPELVASLTLVGSRAQADHPYKLIEVALMSLVVLLFGVIRPIADRLMEMMFGPAWVRNHPEAARKWHEHFAALPRRTLRAVWGVVTRRSMSDAELREIRCPVLVVHGEMDDSVPIDDARVTAARCPELRRVAMLPAVGHTPAIEAPAEVIALLAEFIDESMRLSSPAGGSLK